MESFGLYIATALALVFVIEGLIYALFTKEMQKVMALAIGLPPEKLRNMGFVMLGLGLLALWVLQSV